MKYILLWILTGKKRIIFHLGQHTDLFLILLISLISTVNFLPSKFAAYINRKGLYGRM